MGFLKDIAGNLAGALGIPNNTFAGKLLGSNLSATEKNARKAAKSGGGSNMGLLNTGSGLSGNLRLGKDQLTGLVPVIIAIAIALAIAIGGGFIRFGKKRRRR